MKSILYPIQVYISNWIMYRKVKILHFVLDVIQIYLKGTTMVHRMPESDVTYWNEDDIRMNLITFLFISTKTWKDGIALQSNLCFVICAVAWYNWYHNDNSWADNMAGSILGLATTSVHSLHINASFSQICCRTRKLNFRTLDIYAIQQENVLSNWSR